MKCEDNFKPERQVKDDDNAAHLMYIRYTTQIKDKIDLDSWLSLSSIVRLMVLRAYSMISW